MTMNMLDVTPRERMLIQTFADIMDERLASREQAISPFVEAVKSFTEATRLAGIKTVESIAALSLEETPAPQVTNQVDVTPIAAAVAAGIADMNAKFSQFMERSLESSQNLERILGELRDCVGRERKVPTAWQMKTEKDGSRTLTAKTK